MFIFHLKIKQKTHNTHEKKIKSKRDKYGIPFNKVYTFAL
jgi:hypothetical protein